MNHLDHTGRILEFGRADNTGHHRIAMATIAALCAVVFAYDAFPAVAHVLNIAALVKAAIAAIIVLIWLRRTIRNSHREAECDRVHRHTGHRS
jgi:hypothetical protein